MLPLVALPERQEIKREMFDTTLTSFNPHIKVIFPPVARYDKLFRGKYLEIIYTGFLASECSLEIF